MLCHTITILSILVYCLPMINGNETCSDTLCNGPKPQKCCSAVLEGSQYKVHCCPGNKTCCGDNCCDVCCNGVCASAGSTCCPAGQSCPAGLGCCDGGCCGEKCCGGGRCIKWGVPCSNSDGSCLFGDDFVSLQDGSQKQMKYLRSGDKVYSVDKQGQLVKDEIIMILHGGRKTETLFYTVTTSFNQSLSLTGDHLIMTYNMREKRSIMVAANELKINDYLLTAETSSQNLTPAPIASIEVFYKTGFITPMTYKGTLLVNGIVTSCYVKHHNTYNEMHTLFYPFRLYYYLMKDIFHLTDEPFSTGMQVNNLAKEDEFYGHALVRSIHQSKAMVKYVLQDLIVHTFLNI